MKFQKPLPKQKNWQFWQLIPIHTVPKEYDQVNENNSLSTQWAIFAIVVVCVVVFYVVGVVDVVVDVIDVVHVDVVHVNGVVNWCC